MSKRTVAAVAVCLGMVSAGGVGAPTASASPEDEMFLNRLMQFGVTINGNEGAAQAIDVAKLGCDLQAQGMTDGEAWGRLTAKYPKVAPNVVFQTLAVGTLVYCPEYLG